MRIGATFLVVLLAALTGCQTIQSSSPTQTLVRVMDASYNAPAVNVSVGTTSIATNIAAATITNYAFLPPQNTTANVYPTGSTKATASANGTFLVDEQHSILIADSGASYTATILTDQVTPPPAGDFSLRIVQQAQQTGAVDVYLLSGSTLVADAKPLLSAVPAQTVSAYLNVPAGDYTIAVTVAGKITSAYTSTAPVTFAAGQVRTFLVMDAQLTTNPPVTIIVGNDLN
ncbi:MAG TPA: DUF4397 domain-containing protein [Acidobacteriaceae bacterium]|jgi:hypothetical protein|nr:DUF4397 domain-containing protein [Acidobacteriaceae bacterium]